MTLLGGFVLALQGGGKMPNVAKLARADKSANKHSSPDTFDIFLIAHFTSFGARAKRRQPACTPSLYIYIYYIYFSSLESYEEICLSWSGSFLLFVVCPC